MSAVMADPAHERALKDPSGGRLCRQPPCRAGRPVRSVSSCAREGGRPKAHQTGNSLPGKKVAKHAINLSGSEPPNSGELGYRHMSTGRTWRLPCRFATAHLRSLYSRQFPPKSGGRGAKKRREQLKAAVPQGIARWEPLLGVKVHRFFVQRMNTRAPRRGSSG